MAIGTFPLRHKFVFATSMKACLLPSYRRMRRTIEELLPWNLVLH